MSACNVSPFFIAYNSLLTRSSIITKEDKIVVMMDVWKT